MNRRDKHISANWPCPSTQGNCTVDGPATNRANKVRQSIIKPRGSRARTVKLLFATAMLVASAPQSPALATPGVRDGSHDMDFSIGRWTTEVTIIKDPFNKPDEQIHMKGSKVARPMWGGKGVIEEIEAGTGASHWQGATIFLYDPKVGQWSQNYADADEGRMDSTPSIGGYHNGDLEFYSQEFVGDRAMLVRGTWRILSSDLHTYEIERSADGGRSWHRSFLARVTRVR